MPIAAYEILDTATPTSATLGVSASTLTSNYGLIAWVKKLSTTAPVLDTASAAAGWTLNDSATASTTVGLWLYQLRGNGAVNSIGFTAATTLIHLKAYAGVYDNAFLVGNLVKSGGAGVITSLTSDAFTTTEAGMVADAYVALNSTAGAAFISWDNSYIRLTGGSSSSSQGSAEKAIATSGSTGTVTATWTTSRNAVIGVALLRVTNPADTTAPTVPAGLAQTSSTSTSISMSWSPSTDAVGVTGYEVFRGGVSQGTTAGTTFTNTGLSTGTSYTYTVRAYDAAGNNSAQSSGVSMSTTSTDVVAPTVPTNLKQTSRTKTSVSLSWTPSTDAVGVTGYEVFRNGVSVGTPAGTAFTNTGLTYGTTYSYTVRARDAAGNWSAQTSAVSGSTVGNTRQYHGEGIPDNTSLVQDVTQGVGDSPWDTVNTGTAPIYDADLSEFNIVNGSTPIQYVEWTGFTWGSVWSVQGYFTVTAAPTAAAHVLYFFAGGSRHSSLSTTSGGGLAMRDFGNAAVAGGSPALTPGQKYRIAIWGQAGSTVVHIRMYAYGVTVPFWTLDIANIGTSAVPDVIRFGRQSTTVIGTAFRWGWLDASPVAGELGAIEAIIAAEYFLWTSARDFSVPLELLGVWT